MSDDAAIKKLRDQFLAFAFSCADLFFEVSHEGKIVFALGASKALTGIDHKTLKGLNWLELFSALEQTIIQDTMKTAKIGVRCGPLLMHLSDKYGEGRKTIVTGIKMPNSDSYFMTLGFSNALIEDIAHKTAAANQSAVLNRTDFIQSVQGIIRFCVEDNAQSFVTFVAFKNFDALFDADKAQSEGAATKTSITQTIENTCLAQAINGTHAGVLSPDIFVIVHNKRVSSDTITQALNEALGKIDDELTPLYLSLSTLNCDLQSVNKNNTINALTRSIDDFIAARTHEYDGLAGALEAFYAERPQKIKIFEGYIERVSFSFMFQKVINFPPAGVDHFDIFCTFEDGGDAASWLDFAAQENLIAPFSLALAERTVNLIKFKDGMTNKRYAMPVSARALLDGDFQESFLNILRQNADIHPRLLVKITDAAHYKDTPALAAFVHEIGKLRFALILDDAQINHPLLIGDTPAIFTFLKISAARGDQAIAALCDYGKTHNMNVIITNVDTQSSHDALSTQGAALAQGAHIDTPKPKASLDG